MSGVPLDPEEMISICRDEKEIGTWPFRLLPAMEKLGEVRRDDFYWRAGMEEWRPLSDIMPPEPTLPHASEPLKNHPPIVASSFAQAPEPVAKKPDGCRSCGGCLAVLMILIVVMLLAGIFFPDNSSPRPSPSYTSRYDSVAYKTGYSNGEDSGRLDKSYHLDSKTQAQCNATAALASHDDDYIQGYYDGYRDGYEHGPE